MHRPLREPLYLRVWRLVRGIMLYNTVDWKRASDGLNLPSMTPEERERQRPARNLEIIKPRTLPRAHIEASRGGQLYEPTDISLPTPPPEDHFYQVDEAAASPDGTPSPTPDDAEEPVVYKKRRRYRRRHSALGSDADRGGFVARIFGKRS